MGEGVPPEKQPGSGDEEQSDSRFVLPPAMYRPFATPLEMRLAMIRVIEQAERERSAGS